jgi:peptide/nickel transport system ATP-binding protein
MTDAVLETQDVTRTFTVGTGLFSRKQNLTAVNGVSLRIEKGDVLGLVGESGCGKSTLALMLLGLLAPNRGSILLNGQPVANIPRLELARRVQPIFQDPYSSLNPRKSIGDIISLPLRVHSIGEPGDRMRRVEEMMEVVGLPKRLVNNYPSQLSGGQRQRVAIARALIMRPELVICDEPTSALDVSVQSQILNLLMDLRKELGLTYVLISHNLAVVEHIATEVAVMYLGRIVERKDTASLFTGAEHPYTHALLASVLTPEPSLGIPDAHLGVEFPNPINPPSGCTFHPRCPHATDLCTQKAPRPIEHASGMVECHIYDEAEPVTLKPKAA